MSVTRVLGVLVLVLIVFYLYWACFLYTSVAPVPSFDYFMQILRSCPTIQTDWINTFIQPITVDWGVFNFFRNFINTLITSFQGLLFMLVAVTNILWYVIWFFGNFVLRIYIDLPMPVSR